MAMILGVDLQRLIRAREGAGVAADHIVHNQEARLTPGDGEEITLCGSALRADPLFLASGVLTEEGDLSSKTHGSPSADGS